MESVKDTASIGALIGGFLPLLIAVVNNPNWTPMRRQIVGTVIAFAVGVVFVAISGNFDPQNWLVTLAAVLGASQATYALIWKPTAIAPKVEGATVRTRDGRGAARFDVVQIIILTVVALVVLYILVNMIR